MIAARTMAELRDAVRQCTQQKIHRAECPSIGFVPTMGFLHKGHASLMKEAKKQCGIVVLSIFVNPIQFGPNEDLEQYPRDEAHDLAMAEQNGVDIVFLPTAELMYPEPTKTMVQVQGVTAPLCGASRPGHFDGVTTVVAKLFNLVKPDKAFFGMKDAQQVAVIQQMVKDLNFDVEIVPCPIVREGDGLALSSRNIYLSAEEREQALVLSRTLRQVEAWLEQRPDMTAPQLRDNIIKSIQEAPLSDIDYVEILRFPSLEALSPEQTLANTDHRVLIALAVRFGRTRLIDNRLLENK
ncbi:pantoate--beta-alanine ligase [Paenibacillus sp. MER TA 81-3]|uniref:pantoate--beta-alanine ligase n=1 Tax=Paenibacillus sp. MER TA 81-3 TaxID=2939573 RepID=UPI00203EF59E|nr:pantoate--beta-alanine ligase [Paenibacillus sp. MER TA 81-3]MCM3341288.1 pantoate--beta-alanine ligase [Paenibacillus sp. MER TA 81-3]